MPREEIAFTARPKIQSQSQIFRYGGSILCLPHRPNFSDIFDLCLHWVSVVRGFYPDIIVKMCGPSGLHSAVRPTILKSRGYFLKFHILTILVNMRWSVRIRIPASLWARWVLLVGLELPHTTTLNQLYKTFFILFFLLSG